MSLTIEKSGSTLYIFLKIDCFLVVKNILSLPFERGIKIVWLKKVQLQKTNSESLARTAI